MNVQCDINVVQERDNCRTHDCVGSEVYDAVYYIVNHITKTTNYKWKDQNILHDKQPVKTKKTLNNCCISLISSKYLIFGVQNLWFKQEFLAFWL